MTSSSPPLYRAILILAGLVPVYLISNFHRVTNAVIAPNLMGELTLSSEAVGVLTGVFFAAYALTQIPIGMMLDRIGTRITIPIMMVFTTLGSLLFAHADGMAELTMGRALLGVGCAGVLMGAMVVASRWFPTQYFATAFGAMAGVGVFGNFLATTPFALSVEAIGWRDSFLCLAVLTVVSLIIGYLVVRDAPPGHSYHHRKAESVGQVFQGVGEVLRNPRLPIMIVINFVGYSSVLAVLGLWGGPYLHDVHGLEITERGDVLAIMTIMLAIGYFGFGPLDRLFDTRKRVVLIGGAGVVAVLGLLAILPNPELWLIIVLFALLALLNGFSVIAFAHGRTIFPDRLVGRGMTMLAASTFLGIAFMQISTGPIVGAFAEANGMVSASGYRWTFAFVAVVVGIALCVYSLTPDAKPSRDYEVETS